MEQRVEDQGEDEGPGVDTNCSGLLGLMKTNKVQSDMDFNKKLITKNSPKGGK